MQLLSRIRVAVLGLVGHVLKFPKPFSFVGPDASLSLVREIIGMGVKRVMVITDGQLLQLGIVNPLIELMKNNKIEVEVFSEIEPDPGFELVVRGVERLKDFNPDAVLAVGGGSSIDGAKAMLLSYANDCHPSSLTGIWLYSLPRKRCLPFFAIPTTIFSAVKGDLISCATCRASDAMATSFFIFSVFLISAFHIFT